MRGLRQLRHRHSFHSHRMTDTTPPRLRPAETRDITALTGLLHETFRDTWLPQLSAAAAEAYWANEHAARYVADTWKAFVVAEVDGQLAGFVHARDGFIDALHVGGQYRRCGVGRALLRHAEMQTIADGRAELRLETDTFNTTSRAFYAACGYEEIAEYPDEEWNSGLTTVLLAKRLPQTNAG